MSLSPFPSHHVLPVIVNPIKQHSRYRSVAVLNGAPRSTTSSLSGTPSLTRRRKYPKIQSQRDAVTLSTHSIAITPGHIAQGTHNLYLNCRGDFHCLKVIIHPTPRTPKSPPSTSTSNKIPSVEASKTNLSRQMSRAKTTAKTRGLGKIIMKEYTQRSFCNKV